MSAAIKQAIAKSFNKAVETYDAHCGLQRMVAEKLLEYSMLTTSRNDGVIVDFACGTGISTEILWTHFRNHKIYGVDFSENLLNLAKNKLSFDIKFIHADFDDNIFPENFIDLAYCNMGLQWAYDLPHTLAQIQRQLKLTGIFVFSLPVEGTFIELIEHNYFYPSSTIRSMLNKIGFELIEFVDEIFVEKFDSAFAAIKSIKNIGANINFNTVLNKGLLSPRMLNKLFANQLTYKIGFFVCSKKL